MIEKTIPMWASNNANPATRNHGWGLGEVGPNGKIQGWPYFVDKYILPMVAKGWKRLEFHNPGGTKPEMMQFDQFIHARAEGFGWISKDFALSWIKATKQPGVECICYLGALLSDDPDFQSLTVKYKQNQFLDRILRSVELPLMAGMSIAFDALHNVPENSFGVRVVELLQSIGVKTYVEPWPNIANTYMYGWNHVTTNQLEVHMNPNWAAPEDQLTGEKIILLNEPASIKPAYNWTNYYEWAGNWHQNQWTKGRSVMVGYDHQKMPGYSAAEYLKRLVANNWS